MAHDRVLDAEALDELAESATEEELREFLTGSGGPPGPSEAADPAFRERLRRELLVRLREQVAERKQGH